MASGDPSYAITAAAGEALRESLVRSRMANPLAAIHSAALMLDHLGEADAAARILKALDAQSDSMSTPSTSTEALSTTAVGDAIAERL